jgi:hypothetical protein
LSQTCKDFCALLSDYIDGEVPEDFCRLLEEHLEVCPPCSLQYESLKTAVDLCCRGIVDKCPEDVGVRLKKFLREHCLQYRNEQ